METYFLQIFGFFLWIWYSKKERLQSLNFHPYNFFFAMRFRIYKILAHLFPLFTFFSSSLIFAADPSDDISNPDYRIKLENMDPLIASHTWPVDSGMGAFTYLLGQIANIMLFVIPIIAVISLIIAWYYYILSSGDSEKASKAKTIIKWNLIAILVAFLSYTIMNFARYLLS